jgi:CheY-like chemotaxis protein
MKLALKKIASDAETPRLRSVGRRWDQRDRLQVLLVEDDEADAYLIRLALAKNARVGKVLLAEDGEEALQLLDGLQVQPDLALIDLRMPRKDGLALLGEIARHQLSSLPCVVLSSSKSRKDVVCALQRGARAFVFKPKSATELESALGRVVAKYA